MEERGDRMASEAEGDEVEASSPSSSSSSDSTLAPSPLLVWSNKPSLIHKGLYLGGYESVYDEDYLLSINVKAIVTVASCLPPVFPHLFKYTVVPVEDECDVDISAHFDECFKAIDDGLQQGSVVVHCMAGVSRSVTVVVAYLMKSKGMSMREALDHVRRARPIAHPNSGFLKLLHRFEETLALHRAQHAG